MRAYKIIFSVKMRVGEILQKKQAFGPASYLYKRCNLFYGNRFSQISRLVYVASAHHGNVVRQQLQRNRGQ